MIATQELRDKVRVVEQAFGTTRTAQLLRIHTSGVARILAGLDVRNGTVALAEQHVKDALASAKAVQAPDGELPDAG